MSDSPVPQDKCGGILSERHERAEVPEHIATSMQENIHLVKSVEGKATTKPEDGDLDGPASVLDDTVVELSAKPDITTPLETQEKPPAKVQEEKRENKVIESKEQQAERPAALQLAASEPYGTAAATQSTNNIGEVTTRLSSLSLRQDQHLEAYILQPHITTFMNSTICTYQTELLYLDKETMLEYMTKFDSKHSIIDAMGTLLPDQLRLVQERAKSRGGYLVRVQHGDPVDMMTSVGTVKVKPVLFVIGVDTKEQEEKVSEKKVQAKAKAPKTNQNGAPSRSRGGLFSGIPASSRHYSASGGLLGAASINPSSGLFGPAAAPWSGGGLFGRPNPSISFQQPTTTIKAPEKLDLGTKHSESTTVGAAKEAEKKNEHVPRRTCQKCKLSLIFHLPAEQAARLCDACKGNKDVTCYFCVRRVKSDAEAPLLP